MSCFQIMPTKVFGWSLQSSRYKFWGSIQHSASPWRRNWHLPKMSSCQRWTHATGAVVSCDGCFSSHLVGILYSQGLPVVLTQNSWSACPKQMVIYWSQYRSASGGRPSNFSALAVWWFYNPVTPLRLLNRLCFTWYWSWRKCHSLAIRQRRAFPSLQRRPKTSWIGGICWIWSLRLKAPGLWHGRMFVETRDEDIMMNKIETSCPESLAGQNPWCFLLSARLDMTNCVT